ncbi:MAG: hypothetical protein KAT68_17580 [Bacteroidales bacterium]|nr:hypothetical protein [Bacteroidales bacterium]
MRDEFSIKIKNTLAKRVNYHCSNPSCFSITSGPHTEKERFVNLGVAAHISAASADGPRYDKILTTNERKGIDNGIWLCQKCSILIDADEVLYSVEVLHNWKTISEKAIELELLTGKNPLSFSTGNVNILFELVDNSIKIPKFLTRNGKKQKVLLEGFWVIVFAKNTGKSIIQNIKTTIRFYSHGYEYVEVLDNEFRDTQEINLGNGKTKKIQSPPINKLIHIDDRIKLGSFRISEHVLKSDVEFRIKTNYDNNIPKIESIKTKELLNIYAQHVI